MTETKALKFRRQFAGSYFAQDATCEYAVYHDGKAWMLRIRGLIETAGVLHALGEPDLSLDFHDTKTLAVAVANAYSRLGDDYDSNAFGGRSRITEATKRGYAAEREMIR